MDSYYDQKKLQSVAFIDSALQQTSEVQWQKKCDATRRALADQVAQNQSLQVRFTHCTLCILTLPHANRLSHTVASQHTQQLILRWRIRHGWRSWRMDRRRWVAERGRR